LSHARNEYTSASVERMNLRTLDLNLLLVFDAILRERSVIGAAKRLHLSQPAVSHALNRLRRRLKDQLFVRASTGMMPTPRAEQLALPVRKALDGLQLALEPESFSPATAERRFVIAVNNYAAVVLAAPLVARCRELAPRVRLSLRPSLSLDVAELLERAELDLAISAADTPADRFATSVLVEDRYVVVMRRRHPAARRKLDLATFAKLPHLGISSTGEDISFVDAALASHGLSRSIALEAPYLSAGPLLVQSDMVAVLGRQIALEFQRSHPIELRELPFDSPNLRSIMLWHRRLDDQPAQRWLRQTAASVAGAI
jgi:DNA-binding transcriptional LysR family regulator